MLIKSIMRIATVSQHLVGPQDKTISEGPMKRAFQYCTKDQDLAHSINVLYTENTLEK